MFKETEQGETQYCPMCLEWSEKYKRLQTENEKKDNLLKWLITQQYYIIPKKLKLKITEVLNG